MVESLGVRLWRWLERDGCALVVVMARPKHLKSGWGRCSSLDREKMGGPILISMKEVTVMRRQGKDVDGSSAKGWTERRRKGRRGWKELLRHAAVALVLELTPGVVQDRANDPEAALGQREAVHTS